MVINKEGLAPIVISFRGVTNLSGKRNILFLKIGKIKYSLQIDKYKIQYQYKDIKPH